MANEFSLKQISLKQICTRSKLNEYMKIASGQRNKTTKSYISCITLLDMSLITLKISEEFFSFIFFVPLKKATKLYDAKNFKKKNLT